MEQVKELLRLIRGMKMNGVVVAVIFIVRRVQPCKMRAYLGFDFKGDTNDTRERTERLTKEAMLCWTAELFAQNAPFSVPGQSRAFNCTNPPPQVKISTVVHDAFYPVPLSSSELLFICRNERRTSQAC